MASTRVPNAIATLAALAIAVGGCTSETRPSPSPTASSPPNAGPVVLVASDDENRFPVAVRVIDESGRLQAVRPVGPVELAAGLARTPMEGAALGAWQVDGSDRQVAIVWNGSACDRDASIVITTGVGSVTVDAGSPDECSGPGAYRGVVLVFDGPIVVEDVDLAVT
jgi:hypothetical protein